jgi:hypothetical protein
MGRFANANAGGKLGLKNSREFLEFITGLL